MNPVAMSVPEEIGAIPARVRRKVVPAFRCGRWGWSVEWTYPGEFPVTQGFFEREAAARAVADADLNP